MMTKRGTLGAGSVVLLLVSLLSAGVVAAAPNITCGTISGTYAFWTGSITVTPNGTGTMNINPSDNEVINSCTNTTTSPPTTGIGGCEEFEGPETYALVFSSIGGKHLELIQTDNVGGGAKIFMTGRAEKQ